MSSRHDGGGVAVERPRSQSLPRTDANPPTSGPTNQSKTQKLQQSSQTFKAGDKSSARAGELFLPEAGVLHSSEQADLATSASGVPEEQRRFVAYQVELLIKEVLEAKLYKVRYEPNACSRLAQELCAAIKERTKALNLARYKLVTHVMLGEDTDRSVQVAARCLWNQDTDNFAAATFRNNWIYAVAIVYGMYLE